MLWFEVKGGVANGRKLMDSINRPWSLCENLGAVESIITCILDSGLILTISFALLSVVPPHTVTLRGLRIAPCLVPDGWCLQSDVMVAVAPRQAQR